MGTQLRPSRRAGSSPAATAGGSSSSHGRARLSPRPGFLPGGRLQLLAVVGTLLVFGAFSAMGQFSAAPAAAPAPAPAPPPAAAAPPPAAAPAAKPAPPPPAGTAAATPGALADASDGGAAGAAGAPAAGDDEDNPFAPPPLCQGKTPAKVVIDRVVAYPAPGASPLVVLRNVGGQTANLTGWRLTGAWVAGWVGCCA